MNELICLGTGVECRPGALGGLDVARVFIAAFLAILFLQSGATRWWTGRGTWSG